MNEGEGVGGVVIFSIGRLVDETVSVSVSVSIKLVRSATSSVVSDFVISVVGEIVTARNVVAIDDGLVVGNEFVAVSVDSFGTCDVVLNVVD